MASQPQSVHSASRPRPPSANPEASSLALSVVVPAFNEARTIGTVLKRLLELPCGKLEVIVVDDGSTDGTTEIARSCLAEGDTVRLLRHESNTGKGAAIQTALAHVNGDIVVIQDGDLETDPLDLLSMLQLFEDPTVSVVYGNRWTNCGSKKGRWASYFASKLLSWFTRLLYGGEVGDVTSCYKMFRRHVICSLNLTEKRFSFCPEVTAKLLLAGCEIREVPMSYRPRRRSDGKKIRLTDGVAAVLSLIRVRVMASPGQG